MSRSVSRRLVLGSVSAVAMSSMLAACSQPASYATVDLGGSYGQQTSQTFSPVTGQPLYQSTSLYGPQSYPDAPVYQSTSQLAAADAPVDQVASLGYNGGFDTYGITSAPAVPQYSPIAESSPSFQEAELLSSPEFQAEVQSVEQAFVDIGPLDAPAPAPFAPPTPIAAAPIQAAPLETLDVAPSFETAYAAPNLTQSYEAPAALTPAPVIEEAELEPLAAPEAPKQPRVADDYATLDGAPSVRETAPVEDAPVAVSRPRYQPWIAPQFGTTEPERTVAERPIVPKPVAQAPVAPAPVEPKLESGPDNAFTREALDLLPQRPEPTRLPAPVAVPPKLNLGGGLTVPKASTGYPRPYEALRPGVWPELEGAGQGMVEAPSVTPTPTLVAERDPIVSQPTTGIEQASERFGDVYTIQRGDTLLTIANQIGTTPEDLAFENGMVPEAQIYIGQKLAIPTPAAQVDYEDGIPMVTVGEVADAQFERVSTIQRASIPTIRATTSGDPAAFAWPVPGEVYRLEAGQVEIDAEGNAPVAASAAGKVAHVERGAMGVLVVIEHDNGWRSLTVGLDYSTVRPGEIVEQGNTIGAASREHRVRFELRDAGADVADALAQLRG